jgi:hypothetical protein
MSDNTFEFTTTTGAGDETVKCVLEYSVDESGTYAENLIAITYEGTSIFSVISDEQFCDIEMKGTMMLASHLVNEADHAKIIAYEHR